MTTTETLAYLAGALDADGCFTIKRSTWRIRSAGDCATPTYAERVTLGQVTPQVPELLRRTFGGSIYITKPGTKNSRPLFKFLASDVTAALIAEAVLPYLLIKPERAKCLLELRKWRSNHDARKEAWWFVRECPDWHTMPLLTATEVTAELGYSSRETVSQAVGNGTLVALPVTSRGKETPRFPAELVRRLKAGSRNGRYASAPQFVAKLDEVYRRVISLNKLGVHGVSSNFRTGYHQPAA